MIDLNTGKENSWCPGCGNFGILNSIKAAITDLVEKGTPKANIAITCGIGCHGKIFDYLKLSGIYGLHGRALATATGIKLANPELTVISFGGDGDSLGEGLEHTLFAAKRNMDITLILHNNGNYGLTTGQFSPLSPLGYRGLSAPGGNIERPFSPISLLLEAGATFAARSYTTNPRHLREVLVAAIEHRGFSFVEVLQPCISYNNTYQYYNERVRIMESTPTDIYEAMRLSRMDNPVWLGTFLQKSDPCYHEQLAGVATPVKDRMDQEQRLQLLKEMF
ncbi:MAG TPA: thiamine pyrophosphate-dependent enzyme [Candidatus Cloacimonadota bacterium]|nr:thiamine pyrophosphate-dependent enzyme [Candidatus Cloacimonadota bacterium]